jgi:hypothetical protein
LVVLINVALLDVAAGTFAVAEEMGVDFIGPAASVPDYFVITDAGLHGPVTRADFPYSLYGGPTARVAARPGTARLAEAVESYFNRDWRRFSSHEFTAPQADAAGYPAVTQRGGVIYVYGAVFAAYQEHGNLTFRELVGKCLERLLPRPLVVTDAPATAEVTLTRQAGRAVVHLVNYHAGRRAPGHVEALEAPVPLREVTVKVRREGAVRGVQMVFGEEALPFTEAEGYVTVVVPRVGPHEMVVIEAA